VRGWAGSECVEELGPGRRGRRPPGDRAVLGGAGRAGRRAGAALAGAPARPAGRSAMPAGGRSRRPAPAGLPRPATGHPGASARWSHPGRVGLLGSGAPLDDHPGGRRGAPTAGAIAAAPPGESAAARPGRRGRRPGRAAGSSACSMHRGPGARPGGTQGHATAVRLRQGPRQDRPGRWSSPTRPGPAGRKPGVTLPAYADDQGSSVQIAGSGQKRIAVATEGRPVALASRGRADQAASSGSCPL
jgi:hypothetical protein